jgi:hypothetical protein
MNYIDMVKRHWPGISTSDAECLLWETTCFGFGSAQEVESQIREAYETTGGNIKQALDNAYAEIDKAMEQHKIWKALQQ